MKAAARGFRLDLLALAGVTDEAVVGFCGVLSCIGCCLLGGDGERTAAAAAEAELCWAGAGAGAGTAFTTTRCRD